MKNQILGYILVGLLSLFVSCAEEGPYETGKLECDISILGIAPTSALLKVTIPENQDNVLYYIYDKYLIEESIMESHLSAEECMEFAKRGYVDNSPENNIFFKDLTPNTKYYVVLDAEVNLNGSFSLGSRTDCLYFTDYSFTTSSSEPYIIYQEGVTPFSVNLKVSFSKEERQFLESRYVQLFLSEKPFGPQSEYTYESVYSNYRNYIWGPSSGDKPMDDYQFKIEGLNPETQYYIGVLVDGIYIFGSERFKYAYVTDQSFTTESVGEIGEVSVEPEWITPNDAMLNVIFQPSEKNYLSSMKMTLFLSDKPFENPSDHSYDGFLQNKNDYILSREYYIYNDRENYEFIKKNLTPETKYYFGVLFEGYYTEEWGGGYCRYVYYTDQSFATTAPGDYSKLGNLSFEFLGKKGERTYAKLCFPESFSYAGNYSIECFASINPDFSDSIQGHWEYEGYIREYYNLKPNEISFYFPILESGQYYVKFEGTLVMNYESDISDNDKERINVTDLKIDGPIEYEN